MAIAVAGGVLMLGGLGAVLALGSGPSHRAVATPSPTPSPSTLASTPIPSAPASPSPAPSARESPRMPPSPAPIGGMAVNESRIRFVDRTRQVVSGEVVLAPERVLPSVIWMPKAPGRFPLVVFVHGFETFPTHTPGSAPSWPRPATSWWRPRSRSRTPPEASGSTAMTCRTRRPMSPS
jgi:hypothetical protein